MPRRRRLPVRFEWLAALGAVVAFSAFAAPIAEVTNMSGVLMTRKPDGTSKILAPKSRIESGDLVATAADSFARLKFTDGGEITLRPNTQLRVDNYVFDRSRPDQDSAIFSLLKGGLRTITGLVGSRKRESYEMRTVTATVGIRGTGYGAQLCQGDCQDLLTEEGEIPPDGLHVDVSAGIISMTNPKGEVLIGVGQFGYAKSNNDPPVQVPPGQGVKGEVPNFESGPPSGLNGECVVQ